MASSDRWRPAEPWQPDPRAWTRRAACLDSWMANQCGKAVVSGPGQDRAGAPDPAE